MVLSLYGYSGGAQGAICAPACKYGHDLLIGKHFLQLLDDLIFMEIYFSNPGNPCLNLLEDFLAISKTRSWALFAIEAPPFRHFRRVSIWSDQLRTRKHRSIPVLGKLVGTHLLVHTCWFTNTGSGKTKPCNSRRACHLKGHECLEPTNTLATERANFRG